MTGALQWDSGTVGVSASRFCRGAAAPIGVCRKSIALSCCCQSGTATNPAQRVALSMHCKHSPRPTADGNQCIVDFSFQPSSPKIQRTPPHLCLPPHFQDDPISSSSSRATAAAACVSVRIPSPPSVAPLNPAPLAPQAVERASERATAWPGPSQLRHKGLPR